jgi:hypothetical protein
VPTTFTVAASSCGEVDVDAFHAGILEAFPNAIGASTPVCEEGGRRVLTGVAQRLAQRLARPDRARRLQGSVALSANLVFESEESALEAVAVLEESDPANGGTPLSIGGMEVLGVASEGVETLVVAAPSPPPPMHPAPPPLQPRMSIRRVHGFTAVLSVPAGTDGGWDLDMADWTSRAATVLTTGSEFLSVDCEPYVDPVESASGEPPSVPPALEGMAGVQIESVSDVRTVACINPAPPMPAVPFPAIPPVPVDLMCSDTCYFTYIKNGVWCAPARSVHAPLPN